MQVVLQTLQHLQPNQQAQQQQQAPPPPPPQSRLGKFIRTRPNTFSQANDPMDVEDWLKSIDKKLKIAQCSDHEKVLFVSHQLFRPAVDWWETYRKTHLNAETINWNEFKACFRTYYVPRGTLKLKKEFLDLNQGSTRVNEYLNQFIQLSRYGTGDVNNDEKKQDMFLKGLNDEIQFLLLNTDYSDFQHMVDKAIIIKNNLKEMEKDGKRKMVFLGQHSESNTRPFAA
jgi:hypothetical protein